MSVTGGGALAGSCACAGRAPAAQPRAAPAPSMTRRSSFMVRSPALMATRNSRTCVRKARAIQIAISGLQVLVEPVEGVLPGLFGGGFVITRCGVVMEAVVGLGIDLSLMRHAGLGQFGVEGWPAARD